MGNGGSVKLIKLNRRHHLFHRGYTYAFLDYGYHTKYAKFERAVEELEGYRWDNSNRYWGKPIKGRGPPYYIGMKHESTATLVLLKI
jgi:hypothetical protein